MSYRFMRIIVFFDLPTITREDKNEYRRYRKFLIKSGFIMMQESVYTKLALNSTASKLILDNLYKNKPIGGIVQALIITEKQFNKIEYITGSKQNKTLDSDKRLIKL